jgi:allophanate hydrolase subunit 1
VPAGAVGLAGSYVGIYPSASPGGWRLVGRTSEVLWDVERVPPARLAPGTRVRLEVAP